MEEKVLIRSEQYDIKKICRQIFGVVLLGILAYCVYCFIEGYTFGARWGESIETGFAFIGYNILGIVGIPVGCPIVLYLIQAWLAKMELVVSDKRIYGCVAFGRRVDLPIDSVSAIGMSYFKGIAIGTSSGKIHFAGIRNRDEIHQVISDLIIQRQKKAEAPVVEQKATQSTPDDLKKYKDLLDTGVITQEEFDAKKRQLLGL